MKKDPKETMLLVEPRTLLDRLTPTCRRAFERAAGAAVTARHREVTVEHVVLALLDEPECDLVLLLEHYRVDASAARGRLARAVADLDPGGSGRPVFSPTLLQWMQDAWVQGSAEHGHLELRSGALFARLLGSPMRYTAVDVGAFDGIPRDELRRELGTLTSKAPEGRGSRFETAAPQDEASAPGASSKSALARFSTNLTERARAKQLDPVFGREAEIRQMVDILCRRRKNNPILLGEPGVGKTALVEGLALRIAEGDIPEALADAQVIALDLAALQAGAGVKGELERRLQAVVAEVKASPIPLVLFIDEAHTLVGAGGAPGSGDAANFLKPALARGELRTIAATTFGEYKKYFEKDPALERRFQPVKVDEPSVEAAVVMLRGVARKLEETHGVVVRDEAVVAAVTLSSRYVTGRQLPDKAIDLLDTSAARIRVLRGARPKAIEETRASMAALESELSAFERDRSFGLPAHDHDERKASAEAERDRLRDRLATLEAELARQRGLVDVIARGRDELASAADDDARQVVRERLRAGLEALRAVPAEERLVYADVDEALIASVVSDFTGIPVGRMVKDELAGILSLEDRLRERVRGQDAALSVLGRELRSARSGLKPKEAPLGVFLLVGPSGVGKTETALGLADLLFGGERFVITINMSEFQEKHSVSRLIGSPPGYVGYGEGGVLTEAVRQRPYSVVLLDEVEKADREVMNLFYQVFDKGTLSDGEGRVVDFSNTVVVMTSNLATDLLTEAARPDAELPAHDDLVELVKPSLRAYFKPALLARMTVVPYVPIGPEALLGIVKRKLDQVVVRAKEAHKLDVIIAPAVYEAISARCREVESGARNVDHILRGTLLPLMSGAILRNLADDTHHTRLRVDVAPASGQFACTMEGR